MAHLHGVGQHSSEAERDFFRKLLSRHCNLEIPSIQFSIQIIQKNNYTNLEAIAEVDVKNFAALSIEH